MRLPKITIGILNMNGLHRLKRVINSYLFQDYPNCEIVIVDNGSTDGSIDFIKKFKKIRLIENGENLGYSKGKNILVKSSKGEYILMMDNDIEIKGNSFLSNIYKAYKSLENPGFLSPLVKERKNGQNIENLGLFYNRIQNKTSLSSVFGKGIIKIPGYLGNVVFFEKDTFLALGGFDEIYPINIDDYDLSARAYLFGYNNYLDLNSYVIHHGIETRVNINSLCWKNKYYLSGFSRMIWKNYNVKNLIIWWPISTIWIFYKVLKISISNFSLKPLKSYLFSSYLFLMDFPSTINSRRAIQKERIIKEDVFLKIKKAEIK